MLNTSGAFHMLTKARRELAFGRKGHRKSPSTAAFSTSCSLIVPSNYLLRDETEFNTTGVGREQRVSRVLSERIGLSAANTKRHPTTRPDRGRLFPNCSLRNADLRVAIRPAPRRAILPPRLFPGREVWFQGQAHFVRQSCVRSWRSELVVELLADPRARQ